MAWRSASASPCCCIAIWSYASAEAKFNFAFIDLGLLPEAGSTYLLPRMLGYGRAAELLILGEAFSAETARMTAGS